MDLDWLEDFLEIVAVRNFSTAAAARNISQPAFSRRIKSLEAWIGTDLIDRNTYPVKLTNAGNMFLPRCREMVSELYRLRTDCRNAAGDSSQLLTFAALHTLAIYFFPEWICSAEMLSPLVTSSMHTGDFLDCVEQLSSGKCDFAIVYDHPDGPPVLESGPFESLHIGKDRLVLVSGTDKAGKPLFDTDAPDSVKIPYLAYAWSDGYLGKLIALIQTRHRRTLNLNTVYQSSLAEGLKQMAIAGRGIAWLPQSCVQKSLVQGDLVQIGGQQMTLEVEIRIFRRLTGHNHGSDVFWKHLTLQKDHNMHKSMVNAPVTTR